MRNTTATHKTLATVKVATPALPALPAASATNTHAQPLTPPSALAIAAARTSAAQAAMWHTATGGTMPPPALRLALGSAAPTAKVGTRQAHQQTIIAAVAALGSAATVATVAAWCAANHPKGSIQAQAGAVGNVRCALQRGIVVPIAG